MRLRDTSVVAVEVRVHCFERFVSHSCERRGDEIEKEYGETDLKGARNAHQFDHHMDVVDHEPDVEQDVHRRCARQVREAEDPTDQSVDLSHQSGVCLMGLDRSEQQITEALAVAVGHHVVQMAEVILEVHEDEIEDQIAAHSHSSGSERPQSVQTVGDR